MTPEQKKQQEELEKLQRRLHEDWLKHPVTVDFCKILEARFNNKQEELQLGILIASDEKKENALRTTCSTLAAVGRILRDTPTFIGELNKLTPNT